MNIGIKIENALNEKGLKRTDLSKAVGIRLKVLADIIEKDDLSVLTIGLLASIASVLELPLSYFVAESNIRNSIHQSCGDNGVEVGINNGDLIVHNHNSTSLTMDNSVISSGSNSPVNNIHGSNNNIFINSKVVDSSVSNTNYVSDNSCQVINPRYLNIARRLQKID